MVGSRPAVWRLCVAALGVACSGGGGDSAAVDALPAAVTQGPVESAALGSFSAARPVADSAAGGDVRWYLSRRPRALDDLDNVVAYRTADAVTGSDAIVLHARCYGDRTEVELDLGVSLGDDVVTDGDVRSKRVLVRFVPAAVRAVVYDVGLEGRSVIVGRPARIPPRSRRCRFARCPDRLCRGDYRLRRVRDHRAGVSEALGGV